MYAIDFCTQEKQQKPSHCIYLLAEFYGIFFFNTMKRVRKKLKKMKQRLGVDMCCCFFVQRNKEFELKKKYKIRKNERLVQLLIINLLKSRKARFKWGDRNRKSEKTGGGGEEMKKQRFLALFLKFQSIASL